MARVLENQNKNVRRVVKCVFTGREENVTGVLNVISAMWAGRTDLNPKKKPQVGHLNLAGMVLIVAILLRADVVLATMITMCTKPGS